MGSIGLGNLECEKKILLWTGPTPSKIHSKACKRFLARILEIHSGTVAGQRGRGSIVKLIKDQLPCINTWALFCCLFFYPLFSACWNRIYTPFILTIYEYKFPPIYLKIKKNKKKLRLHMNTNILSFNKCKLDTTWPINKCISRENICTLLSIISQKNIFNF